MLGLFGNGVEARSSLFTEGVVALVHMTHVRRLSGDFIVSRAGEVCLFGVIKALVHAYFDSDSGGQIVLGTGVLLVPGRTERHSFLSANFPRLSFGVTNCMQGVVSARALHEFCLFQQEIRSLFLRSNLALLTFRHLHHFPLFMLVRPRARLDSIFLLLLIVIKNGCHRFLLPVVPHYFLRCVLPGPRRHT